MLEKYFAHISNIVKPQIYINILRKKLGWQILLFSSFKISAATAITFFPSSKIFGYTNFVKIYEYSFIKINLILDLEKSVLLKFT